MLLDFSSRSPVDGERVPTAALRSALLAAAVLWAGCSGTESSLVVAGDESDVEADTLGREPAPTPDAGRDAAADARLPDPSDARAPDSPEPEVVLEALELTPARIEVDARLDEATTVRSELTGVYSNGSRGPLFEGARWFLEPSDVATIDALTGDLRVGARRWGVVTFGARLERDPSIEVRGELVVRLVATRVEEGLDEALPERFDEAPDAVGVAGPVLIYPFDGTMYPAGIAPPLLQWTAAAPGPHRVRVAQGDDLVLEWFTTSDRLAFDAAEWAAATSVPGLPLTLQVDTLTDGGIARGPAIALHLADASLGGDVYYWQVESGDIMRIAEGASAPEPLFPDNAETGTCRGCHTLTRDGGRIGFMYNGGDNPRAGLAWIGDPDPPIVPNGGPLQWDWLSFDPGGNRAAAVLHGSMFLADTTPGIAGGAVSLGPLGDVSEGGRTGTHPAWSPDGSRIAWIHRTGGLDWEFAQGRMMVLSRDARSGTFSPSRELVPAGDTPETDTVSYPTWSPDSKWLACSIGPDNRGTAPATLWLVDPETGDRTHLARANPDGMDVLPSFSPYVDGGYYWLLFYSTRPYGHVSTRKQLWVAAIDTDVVNGVDASYPAFWLPGQDASRANITAAWAPPVCTTSGEPCKSEDECCSGLACEAPPGGGDPVCVASACRLAGSPCESDGDCCPGDSCLADRDGVPVCQIGFGR